MIPQIIDFGFIAINSFGLMVALSFLAGSYLLGKSFSKNGISSKLAEKYALSAGFAGIVGARILYLITFYDEIKDHFWSALIATGGFVFYGGFIAGILTVYILSRIDKIPLSKIFDSFGPAMALAYAIGRIGCQLSGDGDYGIVTSSIFGMSYATGVIPTPPNVLVYPTPIFESLLSLGILFILLKVESKPNWQMPYKRTGLYLALISTERFFIEFLRINPKIISGLSQAQVIALIAVAFGLVLLFRKNKVIEN